MMHCKFVNIMRHKLLPYAPFVVLVAIIALAGVACAPKDEPFPFDYHGTPTPTPVPVANETPERIITHKYDIISKGETIKIAEWDDNTLKMLNFLAGYVIVFGFDHAVEIVDLEDRHYGDALLAGDVHIVLWMEDDWHNGTGQEAGIVDLGTLYEAKSDLRIGASPALEEASQEIADFLRSFVPGDETVESLASRITGGRIGMRPNVAAIKYFKENTDIWSQWIAPEVVEGVQKAIDDSKTGLINRKCIPDGGNQNCIR